MISAIILTKNEENTIVDCLESVSWCNEIIIIDDYSTDRTLEVIKSFNPGAKIIQRKLDGDFASQRNFGLEKAKNDWILFVDADERLSNGLKGEIQDFLEEKNKKYDAFYLIRKDIMWSKELKHGEVGNIRLLRFGKKDSGEWKGKVHEIWEVKGSIGVLKMPLYHYPHQTVEEFLREINSYTDLRAKELFERGEKVGFLKIIFYPLLKFKVNYFLKMGFLDGIEGLVFAVMMSFHSFLVRAKLWTYLNK